MANTDAMLSEDEVHGLISKLFNNLEDDGEPPWWAQVIKQLAGRVEELEKDAGVAEPVNDDILRVLCDQRDLIQRPEVKWYNPNVALGTRTGSKRRTLKKGVCIHHTAVKGGFGAHKAVVKSFLDIPFEQLMKGQGLRLANFHGDTDVSHLTHDQVARALAIAARYRGHPKGAFNMGVPYHAITGANSVLYLNLPFDWVTWHGNGANTDFLGYGWDANSMNDKIMDLDCSEDVIVVIELARKDGHPIEELTCHCAWTNKPRDPGKEFIERVVEPVAQKTNCKINWTFKTNGGKSLAEVCGRAA